MAVVKYRGRVTKLYVSATRANRREIPKITRHPLIIIVSVSAIVRSLMFKERFLMLIGHFSVLCGKYADLC